MGKILTFPQCLSSLMRKHGLTVSQISTAIGCSRSEIKRILESDTSESRRVLLCQQLSQINLFTPDELALLMQACEVSRIGVKPYRIQMAMEHILAGQPLPVPRPMRLDDGQLLKERLKSFLAAEKLEILCMNSCFPGLFQSLVDLFDDPQREIHMTHYIHLDLHTEQAAIFVATVFPVLFDSRYEPLGLEAEPGIAVHPLSGNLMTLRALMDGVWQEAFFVAISSDHVYELSNASACQMFEYATSLLTALRPNMVPLKEASARSVDYPSLCMTFLSHELNRATYSLMSDLAFEQVPMEIGLSALRGASHFTPGEIDVLKQRTSAIHEQRFQNFYRKRKPAYAVMSMKGCEHFLQTGYCGDHFVGFRPFTPEERKIIFSTMLDSADENPYFSPLFLKEDDAHRMNLTCYEKLGVSLDHRDTDYNLKTGYRSVFLMYPDFTEQYLAYYLETLVPEKCHSREESLRRMHAMYNQFLKHFHL